MEYLMQNPTAMPIAEAAMTYLFVDAPPVLHLVPALNDEAPEAAQERQAACGGA